MKEEQSYEIHYFDDDDDDNENNELLLWYGWPTKGIYHYFQLRPLSEILTIANLQHAASRIWTCGEYCSNRHPDILKSHLLATTEKSFAEV